jgi:mono/diheme cytochrome c family protein
MRASRRPQMAYRMPPGSGWENRPSFMVRVLASRAARVSLGTGVALVLSAQLAYAGGDAGRGRVIFTLAAGCGCHTPKDGPVGAGGGEVPTPFGKFYGSNITPDSETGIGRWSDAEIAAAIVDGKARGKGVESPAMPYYLYAGMARTDLDDLIAYLRSLPAVRRANRAHEGELPVARVAYRVWRLLFFRDADGPEKPPATGTERGRYLVNHVSVCVDCHTPRTRLGVPESSMYLAGSAHGPDGDPIPNITPDETGIGGWTVDDIVNVLRLGMLPDFDNVQGLMEDVVDGHGGGPGYKDAPEDDLRAIAAYLKTVPPIENKVDDK